MIVFFVAQLIYILVLFAGRDQHRDDGSGRDLPGVAGNPRTQAGEPGSSALGGWLGEAAPKL